MSEVKKIKTTEKNFIVALKYVDAIISTLREPFLVLDGKLRVISANRAFYIIFKVDEEGTIGQPLTSLGNGQWDIPRLIYLLKEILSQKTTVIDYEVEHKFETLGYRIVNLNAQKLRIPKQIVMTITGAEGDGGGEEELILLAIEDITEHKRIERQIIEEEAKVAAILASIGDAVMACDKDGIVTLFNRAAESMTGFSVDEIVGKHYGDSVKFIKENTKKLSNDFIAEALQTGQKTEMDKHTLLVKKNRQTIPVADSVAPIRDVGGVLTGGVIVFRDITHERNIDKAKSEFVSLASHQLKTPPTAIKLLTERMLSGKTGPLTEKQREYLGDVYSSNQRMIDLVNTLLDVSRIELGAFNVQLSEKAACLIVKSALHDLASVMDKKRMQLKIISSEVPVVLMLDESLFRMVISNLITNAIHYTPEGGVIQVECKIVHKGETLGGKLIEEDCYVVAVSDTGYGIPEDQQGKVFTKFFRADNAREKITDGTGLGLYIVKFILDHFSGLIWFTSHEGEGSVFYVAIPMTGMRAKTEI